MHVSVHRLVVTSEEDRHSGVMYSDTSAGVTSLGSRQTISRNMRVSAGLAGYDRNQWLAPTLLLNDRGLGPIDAWDYYLGNCMFGLFSPRAVEVLAPAFGDRFELLPVTLEGCPYFSLRCMQRVDALDADRSEIEYFSNSDKVLGIDKYVFRKTALVENMIFAIPQKKLWLYCTDPVPQTVKGAGLTGLTFELLDEGDG